MNNNDFDLINLTDTEYSEIGKRLHILRVDILHLNQRDCSDILGISQTYLSLLESGKRKISNEILNLYIDRLNATPDWILYGKSKNGITNEVKSIDKDHFIRKNRQNCIDTVKKTFNLNDEEVNFISRLLSQDTAKRRNFIRTLQELKNLID